MAMPQTDKSSDPMSQPDSSEASQNIVESLERLASNLWRQGAGAPPEDYGVAFLRRVRAAELNKQVSDARSAAAEARLAGADVGKMELLLQTARGLAFGAVNEPGRRERQQDQVAFAKVLVEIDQFAGKVMLAGEAFLARNQNFGAEGELRRLDLSSFSDAIRAIQVIDWGLGEVNDVRGRLEMFQASKLSDLGSLLRDTIQAELVAPFAHRREAMQLEPLEHTIASIDRGWVEDLIEAQYAIYCWAMAALSVRGSADQRVLRLCEQCLNCLSHGIREEEWEAVRMLSELGRLETQIEMRDRK